MKIVYCTSKWEKAVEGEKRSAKAKYLRIIFMKYIIMM